MTPRLAPRASFRPLLAPCSATLLALSLTSPSLAGGDPTAAPEAARDSTPPAQSPPEAAAPSFQRHSLGSSMFILANLFFDEGSPEFGQLNYQYRLTQKDVLSLEALTWRYYAPLGVPYGRSFEDSANDYPGSVRGAGLALVYKRFIWHGVYGAIHAANMHQTYLDDDGKQIQTGYQLFMTLRAGYHFEFFEGRVFLEPSVAVTFWPVNTNMPAAFKERERRWSNYFVGEPGMHFGVNF